MDPNKDFEELFELLNQNEVKYLLVGGYAYAIYVEPRYTKDIDIFYDPEPDNAEKLYNTLSEFGFGSLDIKEEDFLILGQVIQLGMPPFRIDLLNQIDAITFEEAWNNREKSRYGGQLIHVIGKAELIKNKAATGRKQDKLDAEKLRQK